MQWHSPIVIESAIAVTAPLIGVGKAGATVSLNTPVVFQNTTQRVVPMPEGATLTPTFYDAWPTKAQLRLTLDAGGFSSFIYGGIDSVPDYVIAADTGELSPVYSNLNVGRGDNLPFITVEANRAANSS